MKTFLHLKTLCALLFILVACNPQKSITDIRTIDVAGAVGKGEVLDLSKIAKEIKYVPLETTDSSLVGPVISILYEKGHIYVRDEKYIKVFDSTGMFISKINMISIGLEEYTYNFDFQVIPQNGNIVILSMSGDIAEYDMSGNYISRIKTPDLEDYHAIRFVKMDDNTYLTSIFKKEVVAEYSVIIYDSLSNIKMKIPNPELKLSATNSDSKGYDVIKAPALSVYGNNVRMIYGDLYLDTIYSIDTSMKLEKSFIFNYGKFKRKNWYTSISEDSNIISQIGNIIESENYLFLMFNFRGMAQGPFYNRHKTVAALFDKNSGKLTLLSQPFNVKKMGFRNDLDNGPVFWPRAVTSDNNLISIYKASEFIVLAKSKNCSDKVRKVAEKLNENDNPVIAIVKLK